jgi:hypothetical protein
LLDDDDLPEDLRFEMDRSPLQGDPKLHTDGDGKAPASTEPVQGLIRMSRGLLPGSGRTSRPASVPGSQNVSKHGDENV